MKCSSCFLLTACHITGQVMRPRRIIWLFVLAAIMWKEVEKMNKYQRKKAALRKKGVKKERYFIRNGESKWEFMEISETEAMRQTDVILWEEEEPGEWWAVYRGDLLI